MRRGSGARCWRGLACGSGGRLARSTRARGLGGTASCPSLSCDASRPWLSTREKHDAPLEGLDHPEACSQCLRQTDRQTDAAHAKMLKSPQRRALNSRKRDRPDMPDGSFEPHTHAHRRPSPAAARRACVLAHSRSVVEKVVGSGKVHDASAPRDAPRTARQPAVSWTRPCGCAGFSRPRGRSRAAQPCHDDMIV